MIEIITDTPDNVLWASAHGKITAEDYEKVFIPAIAEKFKTYDKIRLLYHLGETFEGYSMPGLMEDAKVGLKHFTGFEKIAIVTDVNWISYASSFFGAVLKGEVKVFANENIAEAKAWIMA